MFRVTQPYLSLLVKPRAFSRFSGKNIILCISKGKMPFKMHKIIYFFPEKKYVCLPYLKFSDPLPETYLFFYFALSGGLIEEMFLYLKPGISTLFLSDSSVCNDFMSELTTVEFYPFSSDGLSHRYILI